MVQYLDIKVDKEENGFEGPGLPGCIHGFGPFRLSQ